VAISGGALARALAVCQVDIKSMIAYSRVVHMGLVIYALIVLSYTGIVGGLMIIVAHGIRRSGLFCLATYSYERFNTRSLLIGRGRMLMIPSLSLVWGYLLLMNLRAPPRWNLLSELLMTTVVLRTNRAMYF
jgi:NADH:ubiquinone oxidoreductase subunit 4 (subunit M)